MNIAFHTNQICLQGTEVALFDYAHFCEELLGHKAFVFSKNNPVRLAGGAGKNQPMALSKFRERFPLYLYNDVSEIDGLIKKHRIDVLYAIKKGVRDEVESKFAKTVIHAVFKYYEPHGSVYAYISKWLSDIMSNGRAPYVPHMIHLPKVQGNLREQLHIPPGAIVFGRYGGVDSFDIHFVQDLVKKNAADDSDTHFIFMNTNNFLNSKNSLWEKIKSKTHLFSYAKNHTATHPRIHFLEATASLDFKSQFINTCDAMLHARARGETFGIAVGEFSMHNCPVITYGGAGAQDFESNHIEILGNKCFVYNDTESLEEIFKDFKQHKSSIRKKNWDAYSAEYGPEPIIKKFKEVFL